MSFELEPLYIWQLPDWPRWRFDREKLAAPLMAVYGAQGHLLGRLSLLGFAQREQAFVEALADEVLQTSAIEGESLDAHAVRSSVARHLGVDIGAIAPSDRHVDGVVEMVLDAVNEPGRPLTAERLLGWQAALFPTGYSGLTRIRVGKWRNDATGPMQVVSGPIGRRKVHFEAPPAKGLAKQVAAFLRWFEGRKGAEPVAVDPVLRAGLAHLWLVTLHPFDDGNGRVSRAVGDMALARAEASRRFYSVSAQIQRERKNYYMELERTQKGSMDATPWLAWFLGCQLRAIKGADATLEAVLAKTRFWQRWAQTPMNPRQVKVLNRLLDGFEGKLTTTKWAALTKSSQDTALRDIAQLIEQGVLKKSESGGRSTSYEPVI